MVYVLNRVLQKSIKKKNNCKIYHELQTKETMFRAYLERIGLNRRVNISNTPEN